MRIRREEKKTEAVSRMKALGIYSGTIQQFEKEDLISISEPPFGANYWIDDDQKKIVKDLEDKYDILVFFADRSYTEYGMMDSFLFVSDYKEEWEFDREDLKEGLVITYTENYDMPDFSEMGTIGVKPTIAAGLIRIE